LKKPASSAMNGALKVSVAAGKASTISMS
jgi:hypothetical protein